MHGAGAALAALPMIGAFGRTAGAAGSLGDDALGPTVQVFRHYTDDAGLAGIQESQLIIANTRNQVFATEKALSPEQAFQELFIGAPTHAGRGANVIEFSARPGVSFQIGKPGEFIHYGSLRFGRQIDVTYAGPNPY